MGNVDVVWWIKSDDCKWWYWGISASLCFQMVKDASQYKDVLK